METVDPRLSSRTCQRAERTHFLARVCRLRFGTGVAILLACGAALSCQRSSSADSSVNVDGTVHDRSGVPLADVVVTLSAPEREPDSVMTAADGSFSVGLTGAVPQRTHISFHKSGYKALEQSLGEEASPRMNIALAREAP
jgi:carboxypeptidase family protein